MMLEGNQYYYGNPNEQDDRIIFNRIMKVPAVEAQNLSSAFSCIQEHLPEGLICEEVTISMDLRKSCWSALCIATDIFPTPRDLRNCIPVKRLLQMCFGKYGVVKRVQVSIHNQPNGDVSYKWQVLISARYSRYETIEMPMLTTIQEYLPPTFYQTYN